MMGLLDKILQISDEQIVFPSGQQSEKGNSIIPFPRVGRANGGSMSPGLIPFPRIGRDGSGK